MEQIKNSFHKIPSKIFHLKLSGKEFLVLTYLFSFFDFGRIYPSKKTIAKNTNISPRTVDKVINSLVKKGVISYKKGRRKVSNVYKIHIDKIDPGCVQKSEKQLINEIKSDEIIRKSIEEYGN